MVEIPPAIQVKSLLCTGRTYLFKSEEHSGDKKHYFVVVNKDPVKDERIILIAATTLTIKHGTSSIVALVEQGVAVQAIPGDAAFIKQPTLFRCDQPLPLTKERIISKLAAEELVQLGIVSDSLLTKLRTGVLSSKTVEEDVKSLVR